jgi:hypothetical protein
MDVGSLNKPFPIEALPAENNYRDAINNAERGPTVKEAAIAAAFAGGGNQILADYQANPSGENAFKVADFFISLVGSMKA